VANDFVLLRRREVIPAAAASGARLKARGRGPAVFSLLHLLTETLTWTAVRAPAFLLKPRRRNCSETPPFFTTHVALELFDQQVESWSGPQFEWTDRMRELEAGAVSEFSKDLSRALRQRRTSIWPWKGGKKNEQACRIS